MYAAILIGTGIRKKTTYQLLPVVCKAGFEIMAGVGVAPRVCVVFDLEITPSVGVAIDVAVTPGVGVDAGVGIGVGVSVGEGTGVDEGVGVEIGVGSGETLTTLPMSVE